MNKENFNIPVLFLIFNRSDTTKKVFDQIRKIRPAHLYIAADGPRRNKPGEEKICNDIRTAVVSNIDWECEIKTLFRNENLGCGLAVSSAITWFFEQEEMGIILEDDTFPDITFFNYCAKLLDYYKNDNLVMHISGNQFSKNTLNRSYHFSKLPFIWGWATWRRAWKLYNYNYKYSPFPVTQEILKKTFLSDEIKEYWLKVFYNLCLTPLTFTWDYQWFLSIWDNNGLVIQPKVNLIRNIGFDENATHTTYVNSHLAKLKFGSLNKIRHPSSKELNEQLQSNNFSFFYKYEQKSNRFFVLIKRSINLLRKIKRKIIGEQIRNNDSTGNEKYKIYRPFKIENSEIGKFTYISSNSIISNSIIGKFCSIGPNFLCGWGVHPIHSLSTSPMFYSTNKQNGFSLSKEDKISERLPIVIGNDVFIGANVTVLDGVTIGDGAVVGAGAVVSKDIPPYAVVVGCPIKIIKYRFPENIIESLLKIKWWDWEENELHEVERSFDNVEEFVKTFTDKN